MTQVAQKIYDDNGVLMKKHGELKIQYLSQENDRELLMRQLIFHKKESQRLRELHATLKVQADKIKDAERTEAKLQEKPQTAGLGNRKKTAHRDS